jgi:hypothetical protein
MSTRKSGKAAPRIIEVTPPEAQRGNLKALGGSNDDDFNNVLANQVIQGLWLANADQDERERQMQAAISAMSGVKPQDELEGMLAAQMISTHSAAMECYRRAMIKDQTFEGRRECLSQANKLVRSYAALLEALDRHRGKGQPQVVRVERVTVQAGGQAIVGAVSHPGGGDGTGSDERSHAKATAALAHAPEPAMRSADPEREPVPVAGSEEQAPL